MPTLQEALKFAKLNHDDKTSAARLKEIVSILKKHDARHGLTPEKTVAVLEELGPTFVKLGQIASTHPDVLPREYCDALGKLREHVAPMPFEAVRAQLEEELGAAPEEIFAQIDEEPLGAASIAQVHKAMLKSGQVVAVKVQRPGIVRQVAEDLTLLHRVLATYEFFSPDEGQLSFETLVEELGRSSKGELDFTLEGGNITRFARNNEQRAQVTSPAYYPEYSTQAVLTMDFADGSCIGDGQFMDKLASEKRDALAELIAQNYVAQIVEDGFFHADPHAGNIVVTEEGTGIEWIDFGLMGELSGQERMALREAIIAIAKQDAYGLKRAIMKLATPMGAVDHAALLAECDMLIQQYCEADLDSFNTGSLLQDMVSFMSASGFKFSPCVTMLGRGLVTLEGTIHLVSSNISVTSVIMRFMQSGVDFEALSRRARMFAAQSIDSVEAAAALPARAAETIDMLQKGQISVKMDMSADKTSRGDFTDSINNFSGALIAAALFIGSCILCLTELQPQVLGVPLLGLVGFACGLFIAGYVYYDMRRGKRRRK